MPVAGNRQLATSRRSYAGLINRALISQHPLAAYRAFCAEQGIDPRYIWIAYDALEIAGRDPRSHALLLLALESRDQGIVVSAIGGLAAQHDLDSLPAIEKVMEQRPDDAPSFALMLTLLKSDDADRIALKYIAEDDREMYLESRR